MNYFEHHLGDYAGDTAHLSWLEDCAYRRLICLYYRTEQPIPRDLKQACRLVRAVSKAERDAVAQVIGEFFVLLEDGYHQTRCDVEIARYRDKQPSAEARKINDRDRQRRSRDRRKQLFAELRSHGVTAPWDATTEQLQEALSRVTDSDSHAPCHDDDNVPVTLPVTRDNTATQTPDTRHQTQHQDRELSASFARARTVHPPKSNPEAGDDAVPEANGHPPTQAGAACQAMRQAGLAATNPSDPRLLALLKQGATARS